MIYRSFKYTEKFRCIASKCSDNCCIGWEIGIDEDTLKKYDELDSELGRDIRRNIKNSCFATDRRGRCKMLDKDGLCEIIKRGGEELLCKICQNHPRFYQSYGNLCEWGIGMSCIEGARLLLNSQIVFSEEERADFSEPDYDEKLFECLLFARGEILELLKNKNIDFWRKLSLIECYADTLSKELDNDRYSFLRLEDKEAFETSQEKFQREIFDELLSLETLKSNWKKRLKKARKTPFQKDKITPLNDAFIQIYAYFIFRYFLYSVYDKDVLSKVKFAKNGVLAIFLLFCSEYKCGDMTDKLAEIAKDFSKEVEYSEDNISYMLM